MMEQMLSVGIDIGTSTTQLVFSKLTIRNTASMVSVPCIKIVDKAVIYRSEIYFTPLKSLTEIDTDEVRKLIEKEYVKANIKPADVDTGAVIITGETARKENASQVLKTLSGLAGDFVVATAGPALEGIIAGKGANAAKISKDRSSTVVNLDIGGGTTNIAVFRDGEVIDTACLDIGGRLIKLDRDRRILYASDKIKKLAMSIGITLQEGSTISIEKLKKITNRMEEILEEVLGIKQKSKELDLITTDHDLRRDYNIDYVSFSGGVADCIDISDSSNDFCYGDIGILLGRSIKNGNILKEKPILVSSETIRATVIGAGTHTTDISGSTITFDENVLPIKNVPIIKLSLQEESLPLEKISQIIKDKISWFQVENDAQLIALAFEGKKGASFNYITQLSDSIISGMKEIIEKDYPIIIIVESDMAKVLGQTLKARVGYKKEVVCIDSVHVENGDYIDIGNSVANGKVVPVIVKTLLLNY
ncbi:ethanolamine ammonia-lyase reactivating factor EutA [Clostridiaceae bacterium M8S5]|nr:ethanolamine ammonia-lyase reactivating factor EutA [Clostridiaceae bacterium M8S5]